MPLRLWAWRCRCLFSITLKKKIKNLQIEFIGGRCCHEGTGIQMFAFKDLQKFVSAFRLRLLPKVSCLSASFSSRADINSGVCETTLEFRRVGLCSHSDTKKLKILANTPLLGCPTCNFLAVVFTINIVPTTYWMFLMSLNIVLLSCFLVLTIFPLSSYYPQFSDEETEAQKSGSD